MALSQLSLTSAFCVAFFDFRSSFILILDGAENMSLGRWLILQGDVQLCFRYNEYCS